MPQNMDLHIPFPSRISPDFERACAEQLVWVRAMELIRSDEAAERQLQGDYAELGARLYTSAVGADLDLGVDQCNWFFLFDDLFDGPRGEDPVEAKELINATAGALDRCPPGAAPIVRAMADIWSRSREGMSPAWQERAERHWRLYLGGHITEAEHRRRGIMCTSEEHMVVRRATVGVQPVLDLVERTGHFEVPARVFGSPVMAEMRQIVEDVVILQNEIVSVEKEMARGEQNNLLVIVQHERDYTLPQSIEHVRRQAHDLVQKFLTIDGRLFELLQPLELSAQEHRSVDRYRVEALRATMRGCYDWHARSGRYTASYIRPPDVLGYLEDVGMPPVGRQG